MEHNNNISIQQEETLKNSLINKNNIYIIISLITGSLLLIYAYSIIDKYIKEREILHKQINEFYSEQVLPSLQNFNANNEKAVYLTVKRLSEAIDAYKYNIPGFVKDITSYKTKFGTIKNRITGELDNYIKAKFEKHFFTENELVSLVNSTLEQFKNDILANQNKLHSEILSAWQKAKINDKELDINKIIKEVNIALLKSTKEISLNSLKLSTASFIGGEIIGFIATKAIQKVYSRILLYVSKTIAIVVVEEAAAGGVGVLSAAVAGGAGGSIIPGAGNIICAIGGAVVGLVASHYMDKKLERKLIDECNIMITGITNKIIYGTNGNSGLKETLDKYIKTTSAIENKALQKSLKEL